MDTAESQPTRCRQPSSVWLLLAALFLVASALAVPKPAAAAPTQKGFLYLGSERGDWVGQGEAQLFTSANARIFADYGRNGVDPWSISVQVYASSDTWWNVELGAPRGERLTPRAYADAVNNSIRDGGEPGMDVGGEGRGCSLIDGTFVVKEAEFTAAGDVVRFHAVFRQHCDGLLSSLYGEVGIGIEPPASLSAPPPAKASLSLDSEPGDFIGQGRRHRLSQLADATFRARGTSSLLVMVDGYDAGSSWSISLSAPRGEMLRPGTYEGAQRYPFQPSGVPGLEVSGEGRACNTLRGRFVVHEAEYSRSGALRQFRATFEQHCEGAAPALFGEVAIAVDVTPAQASPTPWVAPAAAASPPATPPPAAVSPARTHERDAASPLSLSSLRAVPSTPRAGGWFAVRARLASPRPHLIGARGVVCAARVGRQPLRARLRRLRDGFVCIWRVPRSARGALLKGSLSVRYGGERATRTFSRRVR